MALIKDAYLALEDIVGSEYITEDPALLDTYNMVWGNKLVFGEKWSTRPGAVLLPGSTEEVQAIVRVCNRHKITFKPFSSGFEIVATALTTENSVILDMKRMDRILEIDVQNCRVVVEPYVSVYRLQLELAKHGLFVSTISCGPSAGVIASSCAHFGSGSTQVFTGGLGRNILGAEWVLPSGEVLRMGASEAGGEAFSADGPGFGLRGILRGHSGANGGHGVITKAAVKVYPWYGPAQWEFKGRQPAVKTMDRVPDGYGLFQITFASEDVMFDASREIGQAEVAYSMSLMHAPYLHEGNDEFLRSLMQLPPEKQDPSLFNRTLVVLVGAPSERGLRYRQECVLAIAKRWGGVLIPELNTPEYLGEKCLFMIWSHGSVRGIFRPTSDFFISPCIDGTQDAIKNTRVAAKKLIGEQVEKGTVVASDGGMIFHIPYENYTNGSHLENMYQYDPYDEKSLQGAREIVMATFDPEGEFARFGAPVLGGGLQIEQVSHVVQNFGPLYDDYDRWLMKIKNMLDPNAIGDWSAYIPPVFP